MATVTLMIVVDCEQESPLAIAAELHKQNSQFNKEFVVTGFKNFIYEQIPIITTASIRHVCVRYFSLQAFACVIIKMCPFKN